MSQYYVLPDKYTSYPLTYFLISFMTNLLLTACLSQLPSDEILLDLMSEGNGPSIIYQPLRKPIPIIPNPNDSILHHDSDSPTGYRLNISTEDRTQALIAARKQLNQLSGFGPFTPISVSFEGPIDVNTVNDHSILLVNIDPKSNNFGHKVKLNLQEELLPLNTPLGWFYGKIPLPLPTSLFFDAQQGVVDLDTFFIKPQPLTTFYEYSTHSLILRPLKPLDHASRYAVILTKELAGWQNEERLSMSYGTIQSPFPIKADLAQWQAIDRVLNEINLTWADISYAWTYHTADINTPLRSIRDGLYGTGDLAHLNTLVPPEFSEIRDSDIHHDGVDRIQDHALILQADFFTQLTQLVSTVLQNGNFPVAFPTELPDIDYFVVGSFPSPQLRTNRLSLPWIIKNNTLQEDPIIMDIPFFLSVPKISPAGRPPFPTVVYFHGTNSSRFEGLILAQELAKQGIALISFDQVGHGPMVKDIENLKQDYPDASAIIDAIPRILAQIFIPERQQEINQLSFEDGLKALSSLGIYQELAVIGRWEDINQNDRYDPAEGFFSANPQQLCASFWQDVVDGMQLIRILRTFDPIAVPPRVNRPKKASMKRLQMHALAGDFNADGILDIGGKSVQISTAGTSLGGIHAFILSAIDPEIEVSTPVVAGGGLVDILMRSRLRSVSQPLFLEFFGQVVVGCPPHTDEEVATNDSMDMLYISLNDDANRCSAQDLEKSAIKVLAGHWQGSTVTLLNERTQESKSTIVDERNSFSLQVATDLNDPLTLSISPHCDDTQDDKASCDVVKHSFQATIDGRGYQPYDPDFRRATQIFQNLFDHCDPINFARQLSQDTDFPSHKVKTLLLNTIADQIVPISTGIHLANALGVVADQPQQSIQILKQLKSYHALHGLPYQDHLYYDIDDLLNNNPSTEPALGPFKDLPVLDGVSGIRFLDVPQAHTWIATGAENEGFQHGLFTLRQLVAYHRCSGRLILEESPQCQQDKDCPLMDRLYLNPLCQWDTP
jgi:hypothetical protein